MSNPSFAYKWNLSDGYHVPGIKPHGLKVFSTFICGGGSTMGYKLSGYDVLGGVEIDPKVGEVYKANHRPKYLYVEDIRQFAQRTDLPEELYNVDIFDGSPPCSSFSMAGNREDDWGKEKMFAEGQAMQTLDDLFFDFIALANKLKPKVIIAENVKGLVQGNATSYVHKIRQQFNDAGYNVQLFLLNAASMGVPQKRERVFFICHRKDLAFPKLILNFSERAILFKDIIDHTDKSMRLSDYLYKVWEKRIKNDRSFGDIIMRTEGRLSMYTNPIIHNQYVSPTLTTAGINTLYTYPRGANQKEMCQIGTFPLDYDFGKIPPMWLIGMSVPPVMMAQISNQIYIQWLSKLN
jgi:DNA (cytosine-5)-methyltransferase 1